MESVFGLWSNKNRVDSHVYASGRYESLGKITTQHNSLRVNHGSKEILLHWLIDWMGCCQRYLSCRQLAPAEPHVRGWQALTFSRRRRASDGHYLPLITVMRTAHRELWPTQNPGGDYRWTPIYKILYAAVMTRHVCLSGLYLTYDWQIGRELSVQKFANKFTKTIRTLCGYTSWFIWIDKVYSVVWKPDHRSKTPKSEKENVSPNSNFLKVHIHPDINGQVFLNDYTSL